eukprot:symbB.v1.2.005254.t1/scaffold304.1/size234131/13
MVRGTKISKALARRPPAQRCPAWAPMGRALQDWQVRTQRNATPGEPLLYWSNLRPEPEELSPALFFRGPSEMPALERYALDLCRQQGGKTLDLGGGAGSHVLALTSQGPICFEDQKLSCAARKTHTDRNGPQKNISIHVAAKRCFGASACEAMGAMQCCMDRDKTEEGSEPQANETEEQAEGRRQARLLRKMLVELEGSCLKAWRKFFETGDDGGRINEFQFVRMCRQIRFPADPVLVFRYLDDDASGELTLEELDQEGNDIWATFVEWSAQSFSGANDFIQKMLPKNATEKKVNAAEFEEGLVKFGWTHGNCQMLFQANCLRPNEETIDVSDLKWLDVQAKRAKIKRTARQRAMKDKKTKTNDSKSIQETMVDFKDKLKRSYGNFLRAWRLALSPTDSVTISRTQFLTACSNLGFKDAAKVLWRAFGLDELSPVSLDFLDPETAEVLARFQRLVQGLGGVQAAWRVFDKKDVKRVKMPEFIETMKTLEPNLPAKQLFNGLDTNGDGRLAVEDFKFLEKWKLPEFLTAKPSEEAKEDVKRHLLHVYKSYLKAWRSVLDMDSSNRCTWTEFQAACRKIGFMGDVAGAWRALDSDLSGSITLQEVDKEFLGVILQRAPACRIMQAYTR